MDVEPVTVVNQVYVSKANAPKVGASDRIATTGILHFTIGVRDHIAAAKFYSDLLSCKHLRSNERYSFMECGGTYFVLAKIPHHVNPNYPDEDAHHHAFLVEKDEFDRAMEILKARGIRLVKYSDENHHSFPGTPRLFPRRRRQLHRDLLPLQGRRELGGTRLSRTESHASPSFARGAQLSPSPAEAAALAAPWCLAFCARAAVLPSLRVAKAPRSMRR